jgi:hypothetical protein
MIPLKMSKAEEKHMHAGRVEAADEYFRANGYDEGKAFICEVERRAGASMKEITKHLAECGEDGQAGEWLANILGLPVPL